MTFVLIPYKIFTVFYRSVIRLIPVLYKSRYVLNVTHIHRAGFYSFMLFRIKLVIQRKNYHQRFSLSARLATQHGYLTFEFTSVSVYITQTIIIMFFFYRVLDFSSQPKRVKYIAPLLCTCLMFPVGNYTLAINMNSLRKLKGLESKKYIHKINMCS